MSSSYYVHLGTVDSLVLEKVGLDYYCDIFLYKVSLSYELKEGEVL